MTDREIIDGILVREGEKVAPPDHSGRISRWGITAKALAEHRHALDVTDDDIRKLDVAEARDIYLNEYIHKPSLHLIASDSLRAVLVDFGVNSSPERAIRALQHVLKVPEDGVMGGQTLHAANVRDGDTVAAHVLWERAIHDASLAAHDPTQVKYLVGWIERCAAQGREVAGQLVV